MISDIKQIKLIILLFSVIVALCNIVINCDETKRMWKECSSGESLAKVDHVSVTGCNLESETEKYCTFSRGRNVSISVDLTPNVAINQAKLTVVAKSFIFYKTLHTGDVCNSYSLKCPLLMREPIRIDFSIFVAPDALNFPGLVAQATLNLEPEHKEIACLSFPIRVVDP